jgi:uncharacterized protein involved in type VI secretion and phage assembly
MDRLVYSGFVTSTEDPEGLGRVQVELQGFSESVELPWIRLLQPIASDAFGFMFLPEVGDEVFVLKGAGNDFDSMVVMGAVYNGERKPNEANEDGENNSKQIFTRVGHELTFFDKEGEECITVKTPDGKISITMDHANSELAIDADDTIKITATTKIEVEAQEVTITGSSKVDISSDSEVSVSATNVNVSGTAKIALSAPAVDIG